MRGPSAGLLAGQRPHASLASSTVGLSRPAHASSPLLPACCPPPEPPANAPQDEAPFMSRRLFPSLPPGCGLSSFIPPDPSSSPRLQGSDWTQAWKADPGERKEKRAPLAPGPAFVSAVSPLVWLSRPSHTWSKGTAFWLLSTRLSHGQGQDSLQMKRSQEPGNRGKKSLSPGEDRASPPGGCSTEEPGWCSAAEAVSLQGLGSPAALTAPAQ